MKNELPKRKNLRLKNFDYSSAGAYFVTVCVRDRKQILSEIFASASGISNFDSVGDGALDVPHSVEVRLTSVGRVVEKYLLSSENIPGVKIGKYVIMPDHIHAIILLANDDCNAVKGGTSRAPSPTNEMVPHIISTFKRFCNKEIGSNIFQRSYIEHVIRDREDYCEKRNYIYKNPIRWYYRNLKSNK